MHMKKIFLSLMSVLLAGSAWADSVTVGVTQAIDSDAKTLAGAVFSGYNDGTTDIITNGGNVVGSNVDSYKATGANRDTYLDGTKYASESQWRKKVSTSAYDENQWMGCELTIADGYMFNVTSAHALITVADNTYTWKVVVMNSSDEVLYESEDKTATTTTTPELTADFTSSEMAEVLAKMTGLTGTIKLRVYVYQGGSTKYFAVPYLTLTGTVAVDTRTSYVMTTSANPAEGGSVAPATGTKIVEGANAVFTATPATGYKFVSWMVDDATSVTDNPYTISSVAAAHSVVANFEALPAITFSKGDDEMVLGTLPSTEYAEVGSEYTIPVAYFMCKEGYTLSGWYDGTNLYKAGEKVTISGDLALTAVYAENAAPFYGTVDWTFNPNNGPVIVCEGSSLNYVQQVVSNEVAYDAIMLINTQSNAYIEGKRGKVNNSGKTCAQVNAGTGFTIPAAKGMQVIYTYTSGTPTVDNVHFNGAQADSVANNAIYYTYNGEESSLLIMDSIGDIYPSGIRVIYATPAATYTICFVDGDGNALQDAVVCSDSLVGDTITASAEQMADIEKDGHTYAYASGNATVVLSLDSASNVITLVFAAKPEPTIASGTYYIKNVSSGLYFCGQNYWGTQASVAKEGAPFSVEFQEDGTYGLKDTELSCANVYFGSNLYVDNAATVGDGQKWTIDSIGGGIYTIKNASGYIAQSATAGVHTGYVIEQVTEVTDAAKWQFLTEAEAIAQLDSATATNPIDATFLVRNSNFSRNHTTACWTVSSNCTNKNLAGGANENMCCESWHSAFVISQKLTGMPNGKYGISAQGFYRQEGTDEDNMPAVFLNTYTNPLPVISGSENSMSDASASFNSGLYTLDEVIANVTDGNLELGFKSDNLTMWVIWDNFSLKYYGVDLDGLQTTYAEKYLAAAAMVDKKMGASVLSALNAVIATYTEGDAQKALSTQAELEAAITALNDATLAAESSVAVYANVATAIESYTDKATTLDAAGQAAFGLSAFQTAYEDGTLADDAETAIAAAYVVAVKAQTSVGAEFIDAAPSAWTGATGSLPQNWANATAYSFAEYYNGGAVAAGEVLTQTIEGLAAGNYEVVLACAGSYTSGRGFECATGDTLSVLFANDAQAALPIIERTTLDADGATVDTLLATVGEDGVLTYGIKNLCEAGNWYAASVQSIKRAEDPISLMAVNTVANAIACYEAEVIVEKDTVVVSGIVSRMQLKPNNFAKYGSVNIWLVDTLGASQNIELYNCYGLNGDTLNWFGPNYAESGIQWLNVDTVVSVNGDTIIAGDVVTGLGLITLYGSQYQLSSCQITELARPYVEPTLACWDFTKQPNDSVVAAGANLAGALKDDAGASWSLMYNSAATTEASQLYVAEGVPFSQSAGLVFGVFSADKRVLFRHYPENYGGYHFYANKDITVTVPAEAGNIVRFYALTTKDKNIICGEDTVAVNKVADASKLTADDYVASSFVVTEANPTFSIPSTVYISKIVVVEGEPAVEPEPEPEAELAEMVGDRLTLSAPGWGSTTVLSGQIGLSFNGQWRFFSVVKGLLTSAYPTIRLEYADVDSVQAKVEGSTKTGYPQLSDSVLTLDLTQYGDTIRDIEIQCTQSAGSVMLKAAYLIDAAGNESLVTYDASSWGCTTASYAFDITYTSQYPAVGVNGVDAAIAEGDSIVYTVYLGAPAANMFQLVVNGNVYLPIDSAATEAVYVAYEPLTSLAVQYKGTETYEMYFRGATSQYFTAPVPEPEVYTIAELKDSYDNKRVASNDSVKIQGYISNMFLKPTNFSKYGSVCIWLTDTEGGTAKEFELYNCYGLDGDTLKSFAGMDTLATVNSNIDVEYVVDGNGLTYSIGDFIVATGKVTLYNGTYELAQGCYIIEGGKQAETAIDAVRGSELESGVVYDLQGRKAQSLVKGQVYMLNGKKFQVR